MKQGEELYPRKWNHEFIDLPEVRDQTRLLVHCRCRNESCRQAKGSTACCMPFSGGTGIRIGEAGGLGNYRHFLRWTDDRESGKACGTGRFRAPKTTNAFRQVDLHPSLAMLVKVHGERKSGLLFSTKNGKPISQTNTLRRSLHPILKEMGAEKAGFHAFRRYRVTHLRKNRAPEDFLRFWIGHAERASRMAIQ